MKKLFLKFNGVDYDQIVKNSSNENCDLNLIILMFNPIHDWISIFDKDDFVYIWNDFLENLYDSLG